MSDERPVTDMLDAMADIDAPAIPIMLTTDIERTSAFYSRLGFTERARWDDYLIIERQAAELHFFRSRDRGHAAGCYLRIGDAPALHAEWSAVDGATVFPLEETEYGLVEFAIHDPDGNQIRIGSPSS